MQAELSAAELERELEALRSGSKRVRDVMNAAVVTTTEDTPAADAVRAMIERRIKRLPVVDRTGTLIGMVSRVDVLRALAQPLVRETVEQAQQPGVHVKVGEVMRAGAPTVRGVLQVFADRLLGGRGVTIDLGKCTAAEAGSAPQELLQRIFP